MAIAKLRDQVVFRREGTKFVAELPKGEGMWKLSIERGHLIARSMTSNVVVVVKPKEASA